MMRLFIALPLEASVRDYLENLIRDLRGQGADVKWVAAKNIHLTIRFLGETDERLIPGLASIIDDLGSRFPPVDTVTDRIGGFPNLQLPNIFWVGLKGRIDLLSQMAAEVESAVRSCGFAPGTKGFRSHLTLGRVKKTRGIGALLAYLPMLKIDTVPVRFDRIVLYQSTLTPTGPVYRPLHEKQLAG